METTHAPAPDVQPAPTVEQTGGLLLQRKCACGGGSAGLTGHCGKCQEKRFSVQRYSRDRSLLHLISGGRNSLGSLQPWAEPQVDVGRDPQARMQKTKPLRVHEGRSRPPSPDQHADGGNGSNLHVAGGLGFPSGPRVSSQTEPDAPTTADSEAPTEIAGNSSIASAQGPSPSIMEQISAINGATSELIVDDGANEVRPGQMRKGEFIDELRVAICEAADAELAAVGRSTAGCPYVEYWLGYYRTRTARQAETALRRYAPEAAASANARDYIPFVTQRVRQAVAGWAITGQVTGVPPEVSVLVQNAMNGIGGIFAKAREGGLRDSGDPEQIRSQLGAGSALDTGVRSRMESAFGHDFSNVRVHSDNAAAAQSSHLNARAFTIGNDVAFGAGEYNPGSLIGDALLAHELAHVVQQGGASQSQPLMKGGSGYNELEEDADHAAVGAIASIWGGAKGVAAVAAANAVPAMRSGLRLQRCPRNPCPTGIKTVTVDLVKLRGATRTPSSDLTEANNIYRGCCVQFTAGFDDTADPTLSDTWLHGDTQLIRDPSTSAVHAEEQDLYQGATTQYSLSSRIKVFYVQSFTPAARAFSHIPSTSSGSQVPFVYHSVVGNQAANDTLAHEFGHMLLDSNDHHGIDNTSDTDNVMFAPGRTGSKLDASQCSIIYNNA